MNISGRHQTGLTPYDNNLSITTKNLVKFSLVKLF